MAKTKPVLPPLKRGRPDGGKIGSPYCATTGCSRFRYRQGKTLYSLCKQCRSKSLKVAKGEVSDCCCVPGCTAPRHTDGKSVYSRCREHYNERRRVYHQQERERLRLLAEQDRKDTEALKRVTGKPPVLPYAYRNSRPGSLSEALRIDTGGGR